MISVTIEAIQDDFPSYFGQVVGGKTLVIFQDGQPVAEIKPLMSALPIGRPFGLCAGEFTVPADFDAPLPEDILRDFEGA